jgi:hypothetical protein
MIYQLSRLGEDKLKPLFDDSQWIVINRALTRAKRLEPLLKQKGLLDEDDDADKPDERPRPVAP